MKTEEFAAAIGNINDGELILRSAERIEKPRKTWLRFAAAAAAILLVLGAVFAAVKLLPANAPRQEAAVPKEAVLPPSQIGERNDMHVRYDKARSIDMAFEEADAVCIVTIGNWLGENDTCTYFEAFVNKVYKGTLPDKIALYQLGNQKNTLRCSPLFTYGDRLLVCLRSASYDDGLNIENVYEPVGADNAFFYAANDSEGRTFLIDHKGIVSKYTWFYDRDLDFTNYVWDEALTQELISDICARDKAIGALMNAFANDTYASADEYEINMYIYSLEEIEAHFADLNGI